MYWCYNHTWYVIIPYWNSLNDLKFISSCRPAGGGILIFIKEGHSLERWRVWIGYRLYRFIDSPFLKVASASGGSQTRHKLASSWYGWLEFPKEVCPLGQTSAPPTLYRRNNNHRQSNRIIQTYGKDQIYNTGRVCCVLLMGYRNQRFDLGIFCKWTRQYKSLFELYIPNNGTSNNNVTTRVGRCAYFDANGMTPGKS